MEIWGSFTDETSFQGFEWVVVPCNYVHALHGPVGDYVSEECIADRQKQMDYLGNMRMLVYTDVELFKVQDYETSVQKSSRFFTV